MDGHACIRECVCICEVLIGSVLRVGGGWKGEWGAQKQPSGQTSQHQSAPVTRARTIGANIAILPAFTFDGEKDNDTRPMVLNDALAVIVDSMSRWKRSGPAVVPDHISDGSDREEARKRWSLRGIYRSR